MRAPPSGWAEGTRLSSLPDAGRTEPQSTPSHHARDRLLSALLFVASLGLFFALPFALKAGSEFFLPLAASIVISLALAPLADWLDARGLPNSLASLLALATMILVIVLAATLVIQPAIALLDSLPHLIDRISGRIAPVTGTVDKYARMAEALSRSMGAGDGAQEVVIASRPSITDILLQTPAVVLQVLLTVLLSFFMLEARVRLRRHLLLERTEFTASVRAARVLRDVQAQLGAYFATTLSVAAGVGGLVGTTAWSLDWKQPVMWGGLAALLNLLPYIGPLTMMAVLALFGLSGPEPTGWALAPALAYVALHTFESNLFTPALMGRRLAIAPVAILSGLIYFGWIWGIAGLFLAGPIVLILSALLDHLGRPNLVGFLFGEPLFQPLPERLDEDQDG